MRYPPYGRDVATHPNDVFIYAGSDAWSAGKRRVSIVGKGSTMILPDDDFKQYRWPVQGVSLVLVWPDSSLTDVQAFGEHLVRAGAALVVAPHQDDPEGSLFIKPVRMAA